MKSRIWLLIAAALVLGVCYALFYTEWVRPDPIQIQAQVREVSSRASLEGRQGIREIRAAEREARRAARAGEKPAERTGEKTGGKPAGAASAPTRKPAPLTSAEKGQFDGMYPVVFALDGEYRLTTVRVIEDEPSAPGRKPLIVWNLVSETNSAPTKALLYGKIPRGMRLKDERDKPAKLKPGVTYRLELTAGRYQGQVKFQAKETEPPAEGE